MAKADRKQAHFLPAYIVLWMGALVIVTAVGLGAIADSLVSVQMIRLAVRLSLTGGIVLFSGLLLLMSLAWRWTSGQPELEFQIKQYRHFIFGGNVVLGPSRSQASSLLCRADDAMRQGRFLEAQRHIDEAVQVLRAAGFEVTN